MALSHSYVTTLRALAAAAALAVPAAALAGETAQFLNAPATAVLPAANVAVQYELKLQLPEGRGLARLLLDAGVDRDDAVAAARLAAGHLGDGSGGCQVKAFIARTASGFRIVRAMVITNAGQTVIERRGAELAIASESAARKFPRLV
jgi:hypothetical protein